VFDCRSAHEIRLRNTAGQGGNVTIKTGADLAKTRKRQIAFAALDSSEIGSVESAHFSKITLGKTREIPRGANTASKS
jgi:hypothetical protein